MTLLGWCLFSVFAGVGMTQLPYDLLNEFKHRPKPITREVYEERKKIIGQQAQILMETYKSVNQAIKVASKAASGKAFDRKYRSVKNQEKEFRKDVLILDFHYRNLEDSYRNQGGNILLQYFKFFLGCLS